MEPNPQKRKCRVDNAVEPKKTRHELHYLAEFPSELWNQILSFLDMRSWGRAEAVSKSFQTLLFQYCWPLLSSLSIDCRYLCRCRNKKKTVIIHGPIEIHCDSFKPFVFSELPAQNLLSTIAKKAPKVKILNLELYNWCWNQKEPLRALGLLPDLSCASLASLKIRLRLKKSTIEDLRTISELSKLLEKSSDSLTNFDLNFGLSGDPVSTEFVPKMAEMFDPVMKKLTKLESLTFDHQETFVAQSPTFYNCFLLDKPNLHSLRFELEIDSFESDQYELYFSEVAGMLLESGMKHLEHLSLDSANYGLCLAEYEKLLKSKPNWESLKHPLASVKKFGATYHYSNLSTDGPRLLRLCPSLEEMYGHGLLRPCFSGQKKSDDLTVFLAFFLNKFGFEDGQKKSLRVCLPYRSDFQEDKLREVSICPLEKRVEMTGFPDVFNWSHHRDRVPSVPLITLMHRNVCLELVFGYYSCCPDSKCKR